MALYSNFSDLPPLPDYHETPLQPLIPGLPDKFLSLIATAIAYWALSMIFHLFDVYDLFTQYRLHTPAELLKRNHVSRYEVVRDVIVQQIIQTVVGGLLELSEPEDMIGKEAYDIAVWGQRIRMAQRAIPKVMAIFGVNATALSQKLAPSFPALSGAIAGGVYPTLFATVKAVNGIEVAAPGFASWEANLASIMYWFGVPAIQFFVAILFVDTWQYFLHRAMHMNKWLYTTFHSRHHRLYVPYAYGALYNHPFEGFLLDTLGAGLAYKVTGMSTRQGMCFFVGSTFKTVDDHCGYALPWDPLQHLTSNNAGYHDVHHQSWGIKTNFSQPFFTFWDHILGTVWTGGDVSARYERARLAAQAKVDADKLSSTVTNGKLSTYDTSKPNPYKDEIENATLLHSISQDDQQPLPPSGRAEEQAAGSREQVLEDPNDGGAHILREEAQEEKEARSMVRKSNRRRTASSLTQSDSLRGLREKVNAHGRTGGILGMSHSNQ